MTMHRHHRALQHMIAVEGAHVDAFQIGAERGMLNVGAAHPAAVFGADTARLIADIARTGVVCVNARGLGHSSPAEGVSLEQMVDDIESVRRALALPRWVFWGMSGGGWLAQIYAHRHPEALAGIIVESACLSFRQRLADGACAISPFFPAWRAALEARGLLDEGSHASPSSADDAEWLDVAGVGQVFRRRGGPALLVSPVPIDQDMKRAMPQLWTFDSRAFINDLRIPALVIAGSADPMVPAHRVREVHEAIPNSRFVIAEGGGHVPSAAQHPEAVDAVRRFLSELARG